MPVGSPRTVHPLEVPPDADVVVPGSKSITNRALVCAALASGSSVVDGLLLADDTDAMIGGLGALGAVIALDRPARTARIDGLGGRLRPPPSGSAPLVVDARQSGTTSRFLLPVLLLAETPVTIDGTAQLRGRPMGPLVQALRSLGADVRAADDDHLPVTVARGAPGGGQVEVAADVSSQFVSGLLLTAPCLTGGLAVRLPGAVVSRPYLDLTVGVMRDFGASVAEQDGGWRVAPAGYRGVTFIVEPDASSASYFLAAAALFPGGRVSIPGLGERSQQGDARFADVLARMGATTRWAGDSVEVTGPGRLRGIDVDLRDLPDMAPTVAALAVFAEGTTRVTGVGFIRHHETDRIDAVVTELRRCGIEADETHDGFVVRPGRPRPAVLESYDDHRMAMSLALLGLRQPGIAISGPECVAKTFPEFWSTLDRL